MTVSEYKVTGMSCGHCEAAVRAEVDRIGGIEDISVDARTGTLVVTAAEPVDDAAVLAAVDEAGYSAVRV